MILWDVDTQIDFLAPRGSLYVPGSESILENVGRLTNYAGEKHCLLISSACAHRPGDAELETYGPHCMAGTPGQQKVARSLLPLRYVVPNHRVALPSLKQFQQIIIEKQEFDPFTNPNTEAVVQQFGSQLRIIVYGLVTEICVASTAISLLERGHHVLLVTDAISALETDKAVTFVETFRARGGEFVKVNDVIDHDLA